MLQLDDLIEQHAYEELPSVPSKAAAVTFLSSMSAAVPPPVIHARKPEVSSRIHKVVHPPRDSCYK